MFDQLIHRWLRLPYALNVRLVKKSGKSRATVLFLHGLGNTGDAWNEVIEALPNDLTIISIDLLGFGKSPCPAWAMYNAKTQARSVLATFFRLGITKKVIVVGHSLGSLVAIEMAKRYPLLVDSLVLCSPPLYDVSGSHRALLPRSDKLLRDLYRTAMKHPDHFVKLTTFATKHRLINKSFNVTTENFATYMAALEEMIINQTSFDDAYKLKTRTHILRGTLDPFVVTGNLKKLVKANKNITMSKVIAGHEIVGLFVPAVVRTIEKQLQASNARVINNR